MEIRDDGITYVTEYEAMLMGFYPQYLPKGWKIMEFRSDDNPKKAAEIERLQVKQRLEAAKRYAEQHPDEKEEIESLPVVEHTEDSVKQSEPVSDKPLTAKQASARKYYLNHREEMIQRSTKFLREHKEKKKEYQKKYRSTHPEAKKRFLEKHPDYNSSVNREARRLARLEKEITKSE